MSTNFSRDSPGSSQQILATQFQKILSDKKCNGESNYKMELFKTLVFDSTIILNRLHLVVEIHIFSMNTINVIEKSMSGHLRFSHNLTQTYPNMTMFLGKIWWTDVKQIKPWDSDGFCTFWDKPSLQLPDRVPAYPVLRHQHLVGACRDHRTMVLNSKNAMAML